MFFVCWSPLVLYTILYEFVPEIFPQRTVLASVGYTLSLLFGMLTPITNPVFYGMLNDPFKEVVRKRFPWLFGITSSNTMVNVPRNSASFHLPGVPLLTMDNGFPVTEVLEKDYPMLPEICSTDEEILLRSITKIEYYTTDLKLKVKENKKRFLETAV